MDLGPYLHIQNQLTLLIAPPAWGKTHLLLDNFKSSSLKFIFVSPLRALAEEFYEKIHHHFNCFIFRTAKDWDNPDLKKAKILIITPELLTHELHRFEQEHGWVFVLDEFHLYFHWGQTFRPFMWDCYLGVCATNLPVLALTATWNDDHHVLFKILWAHSLNSCLILNLGNLTLKNFPQNIYYLPPLFSFDYKKIINFELKNSSCVLVFVPFRSMVFSLASEYEEKGYSVLSCVGGEAKEFTQKLKQNHNPSLIIATTVLSHGVNLPRIEAIIFTYKVNNKDFWIQMTGRGGRKGESYSVYSFDFYFFSFRWALPSIMRQLKIKWFSLWEG